MKSLFSAFLNKDKSSVGFVDEQQGSNPFAPLRNRIRDRSLKKNDGHELLKELNISRGGVLKRAVKRTKIALRIMPKEEHVLTRYHPQLIEPYRNACRLLFY